jgi:hypothetical protein
LFAGSELLDGFFGGAMASSWLAVDFVPEKWWLVAISVFLW